MSDNLLHCAIIRTDYKEYTVGFNGNFLPTSALISLRILADLQKYLENLDCKIHISTDLTHEILKTCEHVIVFTGDGILMRGTMGNLEHPLKQCLEKYNIQTRDEYECVFSMGDSITVVAIAEIQEPNRQDATKH